MNLVWMIVLEGPSKYAVQVELLRLSLRRSGQCGRRRRVDNDSSKYFMPNNLRTTKHAFGSENMQWESDYPPIQINFFVLC